MLNTKKYLQLDGEKVKFVHYKPFDQKHGLHKTEAELTKTGVLVDEIPQPEAIDGKAAVMCYNAEKGVYYIYEDVTESVSIEALNAKLDYIGMMTGVL